MENERRIKEFNRTHRPFYIVDQDDGTFSLCLPFDLLEGKYANYRQEAFGRCFSNPFVEGAIGNSGAR